MIDEISAVLFRTSACTVIGSLIAGILLKNQSIRSPTLHRIVAVLIVLQGWALVPVVFEIPISERQTNAPSNDVTYSFPIVDENLATPKTNVVSDVDASSTAISASRCLAFAWLLGLIVVVGRFAQRYWSLACKLPLGEATENETWLSEWNSLRTQTGIRKPTQLRLANEIGPLVCFVPFFYLVLVPRRLWSELNGDQRRAVLLHELAHIKRHDLWKSVAIRFLALPQWFNPFAWQAVKRFDEASEWACDDFVMSNHKSESFESYMSALLRIAESTVYPVPATVAIRGGGFSRRIRRLVQTPIKEELKMTKLLVPILLTGLVLAQSIRIQTVFADDSSKSATSNQLDSRAKQLEKAGLEPYRVGSPDLLSIKTVPSEKGNDTKPTININGQFIVQPDGTIDLDGLGKIKIADMTAQKIEKIIPAHFGSSLGNQRLVVKVESQNSKSIYLHLKSNRDYIVRMPCLVDSTMLSVLQEATWPHPVDFAKSKIHLQRGEETAPLPVKWEDIHGKKESEHNHKLLPGDRIVVAITETAKPAPSTSPPKPRPIPASPLVSERRLTVESDLPLVKIDAIIFEDKKGTLDEFEALAKSSVMFGDSKQTQATLKIFAKNGLIETIAIPKIICISGQPASIAIKPNGLDVRVTPTVQADSKVVLETQLKMQRPDEDKLAKLEIQTATIIEKGKTIVLRAHPHPNQKKDDANKSAVYVALTSEVIRR